MRTSVDVFDWGIRQMRSLGYLSMKQHILVLRLLSSSLNKKRRFSHKEIKRMMDRGQSWAK